MATTSTYESYVRPILYILVALAIAIPVLKPLGLPIQINDEVKAFINVVDSLPPGAIVHFGIDLELGGFEALRSRVIAVGNHLFQKDFKIVFVGFDPNTVQIYEILLKDWDIPSNKKYGEDYVMLGYIPGEEIAVAAYARDIHKLISVDYRDTPLEELSLMQKVKSINDIDLAISMSSGFEPIQYINQFFVPYGTKVAVGCIGGVEAGLRPYYPDQLIGLLPRSRDGAEYEIMIGIPGLGISDFDAQTLSQLVLILFILSGNILEYRNYVRKRGGSQ